MKRFFTLLPIYLFTLFLVFPPTLVNGQLFVLDDGFNETSALCQGTLVDDGGVDNDYSSSVSATLDIATPGVDGYEIEFVSYDSESGFDQLQLLVDNGNGFELFAEYEGFLTPFDVSVTGSQIRFVWTTDGSVTRSGFEINWNCVFVSEPPVATFMLNTPGPCESEIALTDQSTNFPNAWTWLLDDQQVSTMQNPNFTVTPGTYDLTLIACNDIGCDTSTVADLIIYDPTIPQCQVIVLEDDLEETTTLCQGSIVDDGGVDENYSNSVNATLDIAAPGADGYEIDFISFSTESGFDELQLFVDNGNGFELFAEYDGLLTPFNVSVIGSQIRFVWTSDGSVTAPGFQISWNCISSTEAPIADFMLNTPGPCLSQIELTDQTVNLPNSWIWLLDDQQVSTMQNPIFMVTPGTYDLTLIACNNIGCDTSTVADLIIYDPTQPGCDIIEMTNNLNQSSPLCEGMVIDDGGVDNNYASNVFSVVTVAAPEALGYQVNFDFFETESGFDFLRIYADDGNGFQLVDAYDAVLTGQSVLITGSEIQFEWSTDGSVTNPGFEVSWSCITDSDAPLVDPTMEVEDCENNTVFLASNSPNTDQVMWDFGDGTTGEGLEISHTFPATGTYDITATAINAAGSTPFSLSVNLINPVQVDAPVNMLINETQNISITSPTEDLIETITWEINGDFLSSNYSDTLNFSDPGVYELSITITDINGCVSDFIQMIDVGVVSTTDLANSIIRIQPNPTKDLVHVLDLQILGSGYSLTLVNNIGQQVYHQTPSPDTEQLTIDMNALPNGIYYLNIASPTQQYRGKRIIKVE